MLLIIHLTLYVVCDSSCLTCVRIEDPTACLTCSHTEVTISGDPPGECIIPGKCLQDCLHIYSTVCGD